MRTYATDLTEAQWALVDSIIPEAKPEGSSRDIKTSEPFYRLIHHIPHIFLFANVSVSETPRRKAAAPRRGRSA